MPLPPAWNDEVETLHKTAFPDLDVNEMKASWDRSRRLAQVREEVEAEPDKPINEVLRTSIPGVSAIIRGGEGIEYGYALKRFQEGKPEDYDYRVIAAHEKRQRQQAERGSTLPGAVGQAALHAPAFVGEMAFGGAMLEGLPVVGQVAARQAAPGVRGAIGAGLKELVSPRSIARTAAEMPAMPSMWAEQWSKANMEAGRDPADVRGLAAAVGLGIAQFQVLKAVGAVSGRALPQEGLAPAVGRVGISGASGPFAQAAADVASYGLGLQTGYGTIEQLANGDPQGAARAATVQALTFAAFHAANEHWQQPTPAGENVGRPGTALVPVERRPGTALVDATQRVSGEAKPEEPIQAPAPVMKAFRDALNALKRQGLSQEGAAKRILEVGDRLREAAELNPALTRQEARALFEGEKHGALRNLGMAFADSFPDIAGQLEGPTRGPFHQPSVSQRPVTDPRVLAAMDARRQPPGMQGPPPPEPPPTQPGPPPGPPPPAAPGASPREKVAAMESRHKDLIGQVADAGRNEKAIADRVKMGFPDKKALAEAKSRHKSLRTELKQLERGLDSARSEAARQPPEPPQAAPPVEPTVPPSQAEIARSEQPQAVPESPVLGAVVKSFPDARTTPRGEVEADVGGRKLFVGFDAERNAARIDFEAEKPGVPTDMQPGSLQLMRGIRSLVKDLAAQGVGIEYRAVDTTRGVYKKGRADLYAKHLKEAGYEQVSEQGGVYLWRPAEVPSSPPAEPGRTRSAGDGELPREPSALENIAQRHERGEKVELKEVFDAANLTDRERHVLEQRLQGRSHEDIGTDPVMAKKQGLSRISRQAVETIEREARAKLGMGESIAKAVHAQEQADKAIDLAAKGGTVSASELHSDPEGPRKVKQRRTKREAELSDATDALLEAAEEAERQGLSREEVQRLARETAAQRLEESTRERSEGRGDQETQGGGSEARRSARGGQETPRAGEATGRAPEAAEPGLTEQQKAPSVPREGAAPGSAEAQPSPAQRLTELYDDFRNTSRTRVEVEGAVNQITADMDAKTLTATAKEFGVLRTAGLSAGKVRERIVDRIYERQDRAERAEQFSQPEAPPKNKGFASSSVFMTPGEWARLKPSEQAAWRQRVKQLPEDARPALRDAKESGMDAREVVAIADQIVAATTEGAEMHNAVLKEARGWLGKQGRTISLERVEEPGQIRGFDEMATAMAQPDRYQNLLGPNPTEKLFQMLKDGNLEPPTMAEAIKGAAEIIRGRAEQPAEAPPDDSFEFGANVTEGQPQEVSEPSPEGSPVERLNALTEEHVQDPYRTTEQIRADVLEILSGMNQQELEATADQFLGIVKATADQRPAAERLPPEAGGLNPGERAALDRLGAGEATEADNALLDSWVERANKILAEARKFFASEEGSLKLPEPPEERLARAAVAGLQERIKNLTPEQQQVYLKVFGEELLRLHDAKPTKESVAPDVQNLMDRAGVRPGEQEALAGLLQGKSVEAVGESLGISKQAAWKRQQEALRRIRIFMGAERGRDRGREESDAFAHVKALRPQARAGLMEKAGVPREEAQALNALLKTESIREAGKALGINHETTRRRSNEALRKIKEVIGEESGPPNVVGRLRGLDAAGRTDLMNRANLSQPVAQAMNALLEGKNLDEAAKVAGVDRSRVWQRQQEAIQKIGAILGGAERRTAADVVAYLKELEAKARKERPRQTEFPEEAKKLRGSSRQGLRELEQQAKEDFLNAVEEAKRSIPRSEGAGSAGETGQGAGGNEAARNAQGGAGSRGDTQRGPGVVPGSGSRIADAARRLIADESGALNFGHLIQRVKDLLKKEKGQAPSGKPVAVDQSRPNPRLQPREISKQIYATPRGVGRIPGVGRLLDPRVGADEIKVALITREGEVKFGESVGELNRHTMPTPKTLIAGEDGKIPLADGTRDFPGDVAEKEYRNPGSQKLFPEQREWLKKQKVVLDDNVAMTQEEGVKKFVDADGNAIPLNEYSPRLAIGKQNLPPPTSRGATGPGATPGSLKSRHYATEAEGYAAGVRYHPDMGVRLAKRIADGYKAAADYRLATDPVLQGESFNKYKWLEKHRTVAAPAFRMRIFPREIADRLDAWYGERVPQLGRHLDTANAIQKALQFSGDVSNFTVQLAPLMWRHPKQWWEAVKGGARAFVSSEFQGKYLSNPENKAAANALIQSGSSRGYVDYMMGLKPGEILTKVPIAGKAFEAFGRLFTTSIDVAKVELWKKLAPQFKPQEYGDLAEHIDNAVGVGRMETIGVRPVRALAERLVALAPTYYRSQANLIGEAFQRGATGRQTRHLLGAMALGTATTAALLMKFYAKLDNDEIAHRMNPQNATFLKVPVTLSDGSKVEVGFGGMMLSLVRLAGDLSETSGSDSPLNTGVHNNQILRWVRNHSSASVGLGMEMFMGEEHGRSPGDIGTLALKRSMPLTAQKAIFEEGTTEQAAGNAVFSFLGLNSFDESRNAPYLRALDAEAKKQGKSYKEMNLQEQARAIKVLERSGVKKPEMTESQKRLAVAREADRRRSLTGKLKATTRDVLADLNYTIPGYKRTVHVFGVDVPIDDAQTKQYEGILAEEYDRDVGMWDVKRLKEASNSAREQFIAKSLERARERANLRLRVELSKPR